MQPEIVHMASFCCESNLRVGTLTPSLGAIFCRSV